MRPCYCTLSGTGLGISRNLPSGPLETQNGFARSRSAGLELRNTPHRIREARLSRRHNLRTIRADRRLSDESASLDFEFFRGMTSVLAQSGRIMREPIMESEP